MTDARIYVDPECPYCWLTSNWLCKVVAPATGISVEMKAVSLLVRNEGRDLDPDYMAEKHHSFNLLRVLEDVGSKEGNDAYQRLYFALGSKIHASENGVKPSQVDVEAALREANLNTDYATTKDEDSFDEAIRASTQEAEDIAGDDVGVPIVAVPKGDSWTGYFGPVITRIPNQADSVKLWEALNFMMGVDGFFELKRKKTERPRLSDAER